MVGSGFAESVVCGDGRRCSVMGVVGGGVDIIVGFVIRGG